VSSTFAELKDAVSEYCEGYRNPKLEPFALGELYDLFPQQSNGKLQTSLGWNDTWPNNGKAGVYIFLDTDGKVLYIGKASMKRSVSARLSDYCTYDSDRRCKLVHSNWSATPKYVWIVGMPVSSPFEAPSLEEYLIRELDPPDNRNGKRETEL